MIKFDLSWCSWLQTASLSFLPVASTQIEAQLSDGNIERAWESLSSRHVGGRLQNRLISSLEKRRSRRRLRLRHRECFISRLRDISEFIIARIQLDCSSRAELQFANNTSLA